MTSTTKLKSQFAQVYEEINYKLKVRNKEGFYDSIDDLVNRINMENLNLSALKQLSSYSERLEDDLKKVEFLLKTSSSEHIKKFYSQTLETVRKLKQARKSTIPKSNNDVRKLVNTYTDGEWKGGEGIKKLQHLQVELRDLEKICEELDNEKCVRVLKKVLDHSRDKIVSLNHELTSQKEIVLEHRYSLDDNGLELVFRKDKDNDFFEVEIQDANKKIYVDSKITDNLFNKLSSLDKCAKFLTRLKKFDKKVDAEEALVRVNISMMDHLEKYFAQISQKNYVNISGDNIAKAKEMLEKPDFLYQVGKTLSQKVAGEKRNLLLTYLVASSPRLAVGSVKPQHIFKQALSGTGKSFTTNTVAEFFPEDYINVKARLSTNAISYLKIPDSGMVLVLDEFDHKNLDFAKALRQRMSRTASGDLVTAFESGHRIAKEIGDDGYFSLITNTTAKHIDWEMFNRAWVINTIVSKDHTDDIISLQSANSVTPGLSDDDFYLMAEKFKDCNRILQRYLVTTPFSILGRDFLLGTPQDGRHYGKIIDMLSVVTSIHQYQRDLVNIAGKDHLLSTLSDLEMTLQILGQSLPLSAAMISRNPMLIFQSLGTAKNYDINELKKEIESNEYLMFALSREDNRVIDSSINDLMDSNLLIKKEDRYSINPKIRYSLDGVVFNLCDLNSNVARLVLGEGEANSFDIKELTRKKDFGFLSKYGICFDYNSNGGPNFIWSNYKDEHICPISGKLVEMRIEQIDENKGRIVRKEKNTAYSIEKNL